MAAINWLVDGLVLLAAVELVLIAVAAVALAVLVYWAIRAAKRIMRSGR